MKINFNVYHIMGTGTGLIKYLMPGFSDNQVLYPVLVTKKGISAHIALFEQKSTKELKIGIQVALLLPEHNSSPRHSHPPGPKTMLTFKCSNNQFLILKAKIGACESSETTEVLLNTIGAFF